MASVRLDDKSAFALLSGLWKGERGPLRSARVLRSTDFRGDGLLDYSDVAILDIEERHFDERLLKVGDIIIERSGGGPKQPVGRVGIFDPHDDSQYFASNFTTALRVIDTSRFDPHFVAFYLHALYMQGATETLQRATTGIRNLDWREYLSFEIPELPINEQRGVAGLLETLRSAYRNEEAQQQAFGKAKRLAMEEVFSRGLLGEPQKETELGMVPESWLVDRVGAHYQASSGGTPSRANPNYWNGGTIPWVKTTEVNYCVIRETEEHITRVGLKESSAKLLPAGTLLVAMYGQGVTRGKVAMLGIEAACNQACAALTPSDDTLDPRYLYHFLASRYDAIRRLAHGGQQQNLNLEIIRGLVVAAPPERRQQLEIVEILNAIDRISDLHRRRRVILQKLFNSVLQRLMNGNVPISGLNIPALPASTEVPHERR